MQTGPLHVHRGSVSKQTAPDNTQWFFLFSSARIPNYFQLKGFLLAHPAMWSYILLFRCAFFVCTI